MNQSGAKQFELMSIKAQSLTVLFSVIGARQFLHMFGLGVASNSLIWGHIPFKVQSEILTPSKLGWPYVLVFAGLSSFWAFCPPSGVTWCHTYINLSFLKVTKKNLTSYEWKSCINPFLPITYTILPCGQNLLYISRYKRYSSSVNDHIVPHTQSLLIS